MIVPLTRAQMLRAIGIGVERQQYADAHDVEPYNGNERGAATAWSAVYGAVGECAVAQLLGIAWPMRDVADDFHGAGDVGPVEVRCRPIPGPGPDLGIRPKDKDEKPYVLAHFISRESVIDIVGWVFGEEGRKFGRWDVRSGCWFLPPPYRSVDDLIRRFGEQQKAAG